MARFTTNAERDAYWAKYCRHCIHGGTDDGGEPVACPVFGLHLFGDSEGTNEARDVLIPRDDKTNFKCTMFSPTTKALVDAQRATIDRLGQKLERMTYAYIGVIAKTRGVILDKDTVETVVDVMEAGGNDKPN